MKNLNFEKIKFNTAVWVALIILSIGIVILLLDSICYKDQRIASYVSAFFALGSTVLFFTALVFQKKELDAQLKEMRATVEAQKDSSVALREQRDILLEENKRNLIFDLIDKLIAYKGNDIDNTVTVLLLEIKINTISKEEFTEVKITLKEKIIEEIKRYFNNFNNAYLKIEVKRKFFIENYFNQIAGILFIIDTIKDEKHKVLLIQLLIATIGPDSLLAYCSWNMVDKGVERISFDWTNYATKKACEILYSNTFSFDEPLLEIIHIGQISIYFKEIYYRENIKILGKNEKQMR